MALSALSGLVLNLNDCRSTPCAGYSSLAEPSCTISKPYTRKPTSGKGERARATIRRKGATQGNPPQDITFNVNWVVEQGGLYTTYPACRLDIPTQCGLITMLANESSIRIKPMIVPQQQGSQCQGEIEDIVKICLTPFNQSAQQLKQAIKGVTGDSTIIACP